jgi:cellobiose phosphorylase
MTNSLTTSEIKLIKQAIAYETGRMLFEVSDAEVFEHIKLKADEDEINFEEAAAKSMDDWNVYYLNGGI